MRDDTAALTLAPSPSRPRALALALAALAVALATSARDRRPTTGGGFWDAWVSRPSDADDGCHLQRWVA